MKYYKLLLLLFLQLLCFDLFSQKKMSISNFMKKLVSSTSKNQKFTNYELVNSQKSIAKGNYRFNKKSEIKNNVELDKIVTYSTSGLDTIEFKNIRFKGYFNLNKLKMEHYLKFTKCEFEDIQISQSILEGLEFDSCVFNKSFNLLNLNLESDIVSDFKSEVMSDFKITNCHFKNTVILHNIKIQLIYLFSNNLFDNKLEISEINGIGFDFFENKMNLITHEVKDSILVFQLINKNINNVKDIRIYNSTFTVSEKFKHVAVVFQGSFDKFLLNRDTLSNCIFSIFDSHIENDFEISNSLLENISFLYTTIPDRNITCNWSQISNKIAVYDYANYKTLKFDNDSLFCDTNNLDELMSTYKCFYDIYKLRGDRKSANLCYIEMKDLETERYKYEYENEYLSKNKTKKWFTKSKKWFDWRVNQFIQYFCAYGTDPALSVLQSVWVILIFAFIYFILPGENDDLYATTTIKNINRFKYHFLQQTSYETLKKRRSENIELQIRYLKQVTKELVKNKTILPSSFLWISLSYLFFVKIYYTIRIKTTTLLFFYPKYVEKKSYLTRLKISLNTILIILIFVFTALIKRVFNSLMLSLNSFITIGYGEISATGNARYFYVIEGVIGWILLTLFSVSLVGQILQ